MINFKNTTLRMGATVLLADVNLTIYQKQRIGIIGKNGSGKSSLLAMLLGKVTPDVGELELPKQLKIAHVAQETVATNQTALDYVLDGDAELREIEKKCLEAEVSGDGERIANAHIKMEQIDAYRAPSRAAQLISGLGFKPGEELKPIKAFSGGWRMRLNLAKALMARSDLLLLDEPTNHLDLDAVLWLESYLKHYQGTLILISHDRDFLDGVVDHIAHIEQQQLTVYPGNYSRFEIQRAEKITLQQATYTKQQKKIKHLQSFIDRFKAKASKAKQAQSRVKALEKMETVSAIIAANPFQFSFKSPDACPNPLLSINDADVGYEDKVVLKSVSLSLQPHQRIAILGPNGAGKSTFIKMIAGSKEPKSGVIEKASGLSVGYFAQHQVDHLQLTESPLVHLTRLSPKTSETELRTFLGSFNFVGDRVFESVKLFSGGEKARLALALIVWKKPNLLLLDEPTNHLDIEMRQALALALQSYKGAMILVSHDRYLLNSTTDQYYLVADNKVKPFDGSLEDYETWLKEYRKDTSSASKKPLATESRKEIRQQEAKKRDSVKSINKEIKVVESRLSKLEKKLVELETILADNTIYDVENKEKLTDCIKKQADLKKEYLEAEELWLELCEKRDNILGVVA